MKDMYDIQGMFRRASITAATLLGAGGAGATPLTAQTADATAGAAADTATRVSFGGFVDGYYAYDFGRPTSLDRAFTTQPARHNEFNVNLAFVEAKLEANRVRGRVALQFGTSVQSNYAAEPRRGAVSGPDVSRYIQEAVIGYQVAPTLWVDGGIFYSNMGMEGWVSRDNPTYTRSLVADYSPYYSSGVKATWQATPKLSARLDLVNGWQNISETNQDKGVGVRLDYTVAAGSTLSYYNFVGNESGGRLRVFNGVGANVQATSALRLLGQIDVGTQQRDPADGGTSTWYGATAVARLQVAPSVALSARVERYDDRDQVIVVTGGADPFRTTGASFGVDVQPVPRVLWRTEFRGFGAADAIFPDHDASGGLGTQSGFVVSSLSLTF